VFGQESFLLKFPAEQQPESGEDIPDKLLTYCSLRTWQRDDGRRTAGTFKSGGRGYAGRGIEQLLSHCSPWIAELA